MLWLLVIIISCFFERRGVNSYIEYVDETACDNCTLRLACRINAFITIMNADFMPEDANLTSYFDDFNTKYPPVHPRFALIKRCSGVNYCSFILNNDCPDSLKWGPGNLTVKYGCIEENRISKYCNENITLPMPGLSGVSVGVVQNPGYPRYYLGHTECRWRIKAPPLQRIKLTILDLSLIGLTYGCADQLEIRDGHPSSGGSLSRTVFAGCGDLQGVTNSTAVLLRPRELVSVTDTVEISLVTSVPMVGVNVRQTRLTARRGILVQYEAIGCTEVPTAPLHGYRVYRNDTHVTYACCVDYAFPDSECDTSAGNTGLEPARFTNRECRGNRWVGKVPIPDCIAVPRKNKNFWKKMTETSYTDVLIPSLIMALLFLINGVVIFVIYKYRQRNDEEFTSNAEEMGVLPTKTNGN